MLCIVIRLTIGHDTFQAVVEQRPHKVVPPPFTVIAEEVRLNDLLQFFVHSSLLHLPPDVRVNDLLAGFGGKLFLGRLGKPVIDDGIQIAR